ncbi:MAG TPA: beta-ketoacyl synthase N-terminal-like domain-containing protein [Bacteroidia bacterium]|nr:beta-ketoacyl synthase N-terminal-like domain-containing protein [Bacteroidia bacterium]
MPNIPANRINNHFGFCGTGFTISAEELSGLKALDIAIKAIQNEELTAALVGAVDMSDEAIHGLALKQVLGLELPLSDAGVVLALKNYDQAVKDRDEILATLGSDTDSTAIFELPQTWVNQAFGYSHAASGLLQLATAILLTHSRLRILEDGISVKPILELADGFTYKVSCSSLFGAHTTVEIHSEPRTSVSARTTGALQLFTYAADNQPSLLKQIQDKNCSTLGLYRLAIVSTEADLKTYREQAINLLLRKTEQTEWLSPNIHYRQEALNGDLAFVFTGAAAAYPNMGKSLLEEFPGLLDSLQSNYKDPGFAGNWIYETNSPQAALPFYQLAGSSLLCQLHAAFTKNVLGLKPQAALGLSSGETNSMYALGVWEDMDALLREIHASELYHSALGVDFTAVRKFWGLKPEEAVEWENWRILAPLTEVQKLLQKEERAYLTIINTANDCVIGGDLSACKRIVAALSAYPAMPLHHDIAIHCLPVTPYEKPWRKLHTRKVNQVSGIRFYSNYLDGVYEPTTARVADALTGQALQHIDFPKIVNKAWNDGVRIFVEHGPRNSLNLAIQDILKGKNFLCVSMDRFGQSGVAEAFRAAAELWCAGVAVNLEALTTSVPVPIPANLEIKFPMHMKHISISQLPNAIMERTKSKDGEHQTGQTMERAPRPAITSRSRNQVAPVQPVALPVYQGTLPDPQQEVTANSALDLLRNQHQLLTEAHNQYLQVQLQGQKEYRELMNRMIHQLLHSRVVNQEEEMNILEIPPVSLQEKLIQKTLPELIPQTPVKGAPPETLPGPKYSRQQLEILASGKISSVLGPLFEKQDEYAIQVRMPEPPLLLCDRVTGIKAEPGSMGKGTIWTETDVTSQSWYLHNNRMPPGIFIEAGQADLLLISYLGIDFQNKGERAYRLLGCELVFYGELPKPGDTLQYEIHVDGYAQSGATTLFFFHYDCRIDGKLRISVRSGQAGFFSVQELEESKGVIWEADKAAYSNAPIQISGYATRKQSFTQAEIEAYTRGEMVTCFGEELSWTQTHTRSPRTQGGKENFIRRISEFNLAGGPAGRGYLRSETRVSPGDWYFQGHFKNDPCMPGTLMADACLQMMAFYMVGAGLTLTRDGWRFEPVTDEKYKFICRGQVIPTSQKVVYEVFVAEIIYGDYPTLFAHVLTTVDGNKAFLCERIGLRLVPDWPLATLSHLIEDEVPGKPVAEYKGFRFGPESLMNCALGKPSDAFGPDFLHYNGITRSPRLPGPPYHFMTRIAEYLAIPGEYKNKPFVVAEYDIPDHAWYFAENGTATMPYAVLMEVALQPCGWFSTFLCQYEIKGKDLVFRNLDGTATQHRAVVQTDQTIVTRTSLTGISVMGEIIIVKFKVISSINGEPVFTMDTVFGFFDSESMKTQKGLTVSPEEKNMLKLKNNYTKDLCSFPDLYFSRPGVRLPASKLLMIDRITALHLKAGKTGKGYVRAEKDVEKSEWFFKAHFFLDPVQPGSLGVEAMLQLIQFYMLDRGYAKSFTNPVFEPVAIGDETEWHYRGQVTPDKKMITVDFEVTEVKQTERAIAVFGEARLWVDGLKIYHAPRIGMRITEQR